MTFVPWDEVIRRLEDAYTADEVVEILDLSVTDMAEAFKERVEDNLLLFEKIRGPEELEGDTDG